MTDLIERAKEFYAVILTDPTTACKEYLAADFRLENFLPEHFPFGGIYEGSDGLVQYLTEIGSSIEMGPLHMEEWMTDGNSVVVRGAEKSKVLSTGRGYDMRFVHWLSFNEEGRIQIMREYNDTAEMAKAFD